MKWIKIFLYLKFLIIACCFCFLYGMGVEARSNDNIRGFEVSVKDDLDHGRDFVLFGEHKIYRAKENPKHWYYKLSHKKGGKK